MLYGEYINFEGKCFCISDVDYVVVDCGSGCLVVVLLGGDRLVFVRRKVLNLMELLDYFVECGLNKEVRYI